MMADEARLWLSGGRTIMDRVTESLLTEFSEEHQIAALPEDKRFEHFAASVTVQRHYAETFDSDDIVTGAGSDTGLDAIAIIVNGALVSDIETFEDHAEMFGNLDVVFVFVQAERSPNFDSAKIGVFGYGVSDFFSETPKLVRNAKVIEAASIMTEIYKRSSKFKGRNPACRLYYVTTGKWQNDAVLEARRKTVVEDIEATGLFRDVEFEPIDANRLQRLYQQSKNAVSKEFIFANKTLIPDVPGVKEAYLGFLPVTEFVKLIKDETGEIISGLFYDNVRDWLDSNPVNDEIRSTLESDSRARFVLMNNGITIIARVLQTTGNKFLIEDFSIVNGCQTSHVIFSEKNLDETVMVPIRLIGTQDEQIINDIIKATNSQTAVKPEQFYALQEFSKSLELYCQTFPVQHKLYYERRTRQYHRLPIEKTRIVTPANMIKAYGAMFLEEPHRTTKNYASLQALVGTRIFAQGQRMEPYYTAAYALYKLEYSFRNGKIESKYKAARFHILLVARYLANPSRPPRDNANEMEKFCKSINDILWDPIASELLIAKAASIIAKVSLGKFDRDNFRTEAFTKSVVGEATAAAQGLAEKILL